MAGEFTTLCFEHADGLCVGIAVLRLGALKCLEVRENEMEVRDNKTEEQKRKGH